MKKFFLVVLGCGLQLLCEANNIQVSNVTLTGQNTGAATPYTLVKFDLSWDNSWRLSAGPSNWDAAWVFVKFQITGGSGCTASTLWKHCTLSATSTDHSVPGGFSVDGVSDTRGVFIYRSASGSGSNSMTGITLRWNYSTDGVANSCTVNVKVFAMEMVFVPQGSFYLGDGVIGGNGRFESAPYGSGTPFQVTPSTLPSTLGGGTAGSLGNNNNTGQTTFDDFNNGTSKSLPAIFPNGYNKFYCMKYEISQEQYYEFLNTLTGTQQSARTFATTAGNFHSNAAGSTSPQNRCGVRCQVAPVGATPGVYGSDLNTNGTYNEVAFDGRYIAMNFLSSPDLLAYLDWSGLRPMTELELEKACRGTNFPANNEYAWGTTTPTAIASIAGGTSGADNETSNTAGANINYNNALGGPVRCGIFATGSSTQAQAGATWYGIMEMSGNVWEDAVTVGSVAGRSYTGLHGDGSLNTAGAADVDYWPGINGNNTSTVANGNYLGATGVTGYAGIGFALGTYNNNAWIQVSDRQYRAGYAGLGNRDQRNGGRGVRNAP